MADKIDEEHLDNPTNTQSENSSDVIILTNATEITNQNQETENMEVHAHDLHKAPGHGWKHYLFEFLMLFLAVFCGFLAENIREHKVETEREKQYVESLMNDLKTDIINIESVQKRNLANKQMGDSLFLQLTSPDYLTKTNSIYYFGRRFSTRIHFNMTDGTLKQLTNAGGLRLIRQRNLVDSLQAYQNLYSEVMQAQEVKEIQLQSYREDIFKVFDVRVFEKMISVEEIIRPIGNPALISQNKVVINGLLMKAHYVKRNISLLMILLDRMRIKALNLQKTINDGYHNY